MKIKTTGQQLNEFSATAQRYLSVKPERTKFAHALTRMVMRAKPILQVIADECDDIRVRYAATDEDGVLLTEGEKSDFRFKPEELIKSTQEQRAVYQKEVEIEPYMAISVPRDLTFPQIEVFDRFVLEADKLDAMWQKEDDEEKAVKLD